MTFKVPYTRSDVQEASIEERLKQCIIFAIDHDGELPRTEAVNGTEYVLDVDEVSVVYSDDPGTTCSIKVWPGKLIWQKWSDSDGHDRLTEELSFAAATGTISDLATFNSRITD